MEKLKLQERQQIRDGIQGEVRAPGPEHSGVGGCQPWARSKLGEKSVLRVKAATRKTKMRSAPRRFLRVDGKDKRQNWGGSSWATQQVLTDGKLLS